MIRLIFGSFWDHRYQPDNAILSAGDSEFRDLRVGFRLARGAR